VTARSSGGERGEERESHVDDSLEATFSKELIALAGTIGEKSDPVEERVQQLFANLPDPLLSEADVHALLCGHIPQDEIKPAMKSLVEKGVLESSNQTLRPLDEEGPVLFRMTSLSRKLAMNVATCSGVQ
jgi:hypothetical protein